MAGITCTACGKAKMEAKEIPLLETSFEGVAIRVPNAQVRECPACGERTYNARELRRWKEIKERSLAESGSIPIGSDVKTVREKLGLSMAQFADLVAVTRQTVHAWERAGDQPMNVGPAAILVSLLKRAEPGTPIDVATFMGDLAALRGKPLGCFPASTRSEASASGRLKPQPPRGASRWSTRAA